MKILFFSKFISREAYFWGIGIVCTNIKGISNVPEVLDVCRSIFISF